MEKPVYDLKHSADGYFYFFDSIGEKAIKKAIGFTPFEGSPEIVELVFGDLTDNRTIDFLTVSNNQDLILVISTVIKSLKDFLERFPAKSIYFRGSSDARTRLYRAVIAKNLEANELYYEIFGILGNEKIKYGD